MLSISSGTGSHGPKCEVICKAALIKGMAVINGPKTCNLFHLMCNLPSVKLFHHIGLQVQRHRLNKKKNCSEPAWRGRVANTGLALLTGSPSKNQILDTSEISATIWSILKILISDRHGAGILNRQLQSTFYATRRLFLHLNLCLQPFNKLNMVKCPTGMEADKSRSKWTENENQINFQILGSGFARQWIILLVDQSCFNSLNPDQGHTHRTCLRFVPCATVSFLRHWVVKHLYPNHLLKIWKSQNQKIAF